MLLCTVSDDRSGRKDGLYGETQKKVQRFFEARPEFGLNQFLMLTWDDIVKTDFYENNKVLLDNIDPSRNGRAYKAFTVAKGLASLQDGDFLIYSDVSPVMWDVTRAEFMLAHYSGENKVYDLEVIKNVCASNDGLLAALVRWDSRPLPRGHLGIHTHANFTTNRCMRKMGLEQYAHSLMPASGMLVFQKSAKIEALVDEWLKWNLIDECCALGKAEIPNDYSFWDGEESHLKLGARHDQSILGLLICREGYKIAMPPEYPHIPHHNFLQFCRRGTEYLFINPNDNPDTEIRLKKGDKVINDKGVELTVWEIRQVNNIETLIVGVHRESCYATTADKITKV